MNSFEDFLIAVITMSLFSQQDLLRCECPTVTVVQRCATCSALWYATSSLSFLCSAACGWTAVLFNSLDTDANGCVDEVSTGLCPK